MEVSEDRWQEADSGVTQSREILDVLTGVVKQAAAIGHSIAADSGAAS
jgi:hypothetical protein